MPAMTDSFMSNFFTIKMWFSIYTGSLTPLFRNILIVVIVLFIAGIIFVWYKNKNNTDKLYYRLWQSLFNFNVTGLIIGLFLFFFTYQTIPFLSARFWFIVWFLIHAFWGYIIYRRLKKLPEIRKELEAKREFNKYIP